LLLFPAWGTGSIPLSFLSPSPTTLCILYPINPVLLK
jgi:hypothetical protein